MKRKIVGVVLLILAVVAPVSNARQQPFGPCTNYGCIETFTMAQIMVNGASGCVLFQWNTGRKLRTSGGNQGGDPITENGTQTVNYSYSSCASCIPPSLNNIAIAGDPSQAQGPWGLQSFGNYSCPAQGPIDID